MGKPHPYKEKGEEAMRTLARMATKDETKAVIPVLRAKVEENRNELGHCPFCSQPIHDVTETFTKQTMVNVLFVLVQWCEEKRVHEFDMKDVKHLLDHTQHANLNHLVYTDGIFYRPEDAEGKQVKGRYGIHLERAHEFFRGERKALVQIISNRFTGERVGETWKYIHEFPDITDFLDKYGQYVVPKPMTLL